MDEGRDAVDVSSGVDPRRRELGEEAERELRPDTERRQRAGVHHSAGSTLHYDILTGLCEYSVTGWGRHCVYYGPHYSTVDLQLVVSQWWRCGGWRFSRWLLAGR